MRPESQTIAVLQDRTSNILQQLYWIYSRSSDIEHKENAALQFLLLASKEQVQFKQMVQFMLLPRAARCVPIVQAQVYTFSKLVRENKLDLLDCAEQMETWLERLVAQSRRAQHPTLTVGEIDEFKLMLLTQGPVHSRIKKFYDLEYSPSLGYRIIRTVALKARAPRTDLSQDR